MADLSTATTPPTPQPELPAWVLRTIDRVDVADDVSALALVDAFTDTNGMTDSERVASVRAVLAAHRAAREAVSR